MKSKNEIINLVNIKIVRESISINNKLLYNTCVIPNDAAAIKYGLSFTILIYYILHDRFGYLSYNLNIAFSFILASIMISIFVLYFLGISNKYFGIVSI